MHPHDGKNKTTTFSHITTLARLLCIIGKNISTTHDCKNPRRLQLLTRNDVSKLEIDKPILSNHRMATQRGLTRYKVAGHEDHTEQS